MVPEVSVWFRGRCVASAVACGIGSRRPLKFDRRSRCSPVPTNFAVGDVSVFVPLQDLYTALESLKMEYGIIYQEDITIFFI